MRNVKAPCGHPGEHVIGNYVKCLAGCDGRAAAVAPKLSSFRSEPSAVFAPGWTGSISDGRLAEIPTTVDAHGVGPVLALQARAIGVDPALVRDILWRANAIATGIPGVHRTRVTGMSGLSVAITEIDHHKLSTQFDRDVVIAVIRERIALEYPSLRAEIVFATLDVRLERACRRIEHVAATTGRELTDSYIAREVTRQVNARGRCDVGVTVINRTIPGMVRWEVRARRRDADLDFACMLHG
jgi:hypothetical protein